MLQEKLRCLIHLGPRAPQHCEPRPARKGARPATFAAIVRATAQSTAPPMSVPRITLVRHLVEVAGDRSDDRENGGANEDRCDPEMPYDSEHAR